MTTVNAKTLKTLKSGKSVKRSFDKAIELINALREHGFKPYAHRNGKLVYGSLCKRESYWISI